MKQSSRALSLGWEHAKVVPLYCSEQLCTSRNSSNKFLWPLPLPLLRHHSVIQGQLHIIMEAEGAFGSQVVALILTGLFLVVLGPRLSLDIRPRYPPGLLACLAWILGWIPVDKSLYSSHWLRPPLSPSLSAYRYTWIFCTPPKTPKTGDAGAPPLAFLLPNHSILCDPCCCF